MPNSFPHLHRLARELALPLPPRVLVNRYGLPFGRSRAPTTYSGSGLRFRSYYTHVCLRCGWAFKPPRHQSHRIAGCNLVVAQLGDPDTLRHVARNLFGREFRRKSRKFRRNSRRGPR